MANLRDLGNRLNKYADKLEAAPSLVAADISVFLVETLVSRTPVDTSKALSNWILSIDDPVLIDMEAYYEGVFGSTAASSANEAIAFAKTKIKEKQPGQPVYISNSAPYIKELDEGSSKQAPSGFTKISVFLARRRIKETFKRVMSNG